MIRFSANLGFLWTDLSLPDAIHAAKAAGFDAVECHWPYDVPAQEVKQALADTGLAMLGLNTSRGNVAKGDMGLAALTGRGAEARAAIDQALDYGAEIGAGAVHVMAGNAAGDEANVTFLANLHYATKQAAALGMTILIEPLNAHDAPDYFLRDTRQAARIIAAVNARNLRLMFDCYHVGRTEGDVIARLETLLPLIGHIQFASVPDRGTPDHGDVEYGAVFNQLKTLGYTAPLGAEYKPDGATDDSLGWMQTLRG